MAKTITQILDYPYKKDDDSIVSDFMNIMTNEKTMPTSTQYEKIIDKITKNKTKSILVSGNIDHKLEMINAITNIIHYNLKQKNITDIISSIYCHSFNNTIWIDNIYTQLSESQLKLLREKNYDDNIANIINGNNFDKNDLNKIIKIYRCDNFSSYVIFKTIYDKHNIKLDHDSLHILKKWKNNSFESIVNYITDFIEPNVKCLTIILKEIKYEVIMPYFENVFTAIKKMSDLGEIFKEYS